MPSGFIVFPDGRCFSRCWPAHDAVLRAVAEELSAPPLRQWLLEQLPGPDDVEELGYGGWLRRSDCTSILRHIDLRMMTFENQRLFCEAAKRAASVLRDDGQLAGNLSDLADMISRMERGETPLSKSDWDSVVPPKGKRIGPGWPAVEPPTGPA